MTGLCHANKLIARDEGLHWDFACLLYSKINNRVPTEQAHKIIITAVDIERKFITESLPEKLLGMNSKLMSEYIEMCADWLLVALGYNKYYNTGNPFPWMNTI